MNRRQFIKGFSVGGLTLGFGGTALWLSIEKHQGELSMDSSLLILERLDTAAIKSIGEWNIAQIFTHCAQSVEFSMLGFPKHKSAVFKNTIGATAFAAFNAKGKMKHNLNEAIPGAEALLLNADAEVAKVRFAKAMQDFKVYQGELGEHFAYGKLSKAEYERAHAMHFNNHLIELI